MKRLLLSFGILAMAVGCRHENHLLIGSWSQIKFSLVSNEEIRWDFGQNGRAKSLVRSNFMGLQSQWRVTDNFKYSFKPGSDFFTLRSANSRKSDTCEIIWLDNEDLYFTGTNPSLDFKGRRW